MSRRRGIVLAKQVSARVESKSAPQVESECIGGVNAPLLCSGRFLISDSAGPLVCSAAKQTQLAVMLRIACDTLELHTSRRVLGHFFILPLYIPARNASNAWPA